MGAELERCTLFYLYRRVCLTIRKGLVQEKEGGCLAPHVHTLCFMCSFTPQPAECNWEICSKELLLLFLPPPFVHLLLPISPLALRSCRAGQWAARTDGGLAPALVQWNDPMHPLAERSDVLLMPAYVPELQPSLAPPQGPDRWSASQSCCTPGSCTSQPAPYKMLWRYVEQQKYY